MAAPQPPALPNDLSLNKYSLEFPYSELCQATKNFDPSRRLGSGAFGAVYRGSRMDGTEIAVKVIDVPEEGGFEEEVRVLSKFRHPNLVILMGFARRGSQRLLIYELLEGGDVFKRLMRSSSEGVPFPWRQRVSVAYDAACGLSHLHNSKPKAFHRDIKSPNILLDRNGTAKMADFGLACLSNTVARQVDQAGGTPGYACPLYATRSVVTEGSEVYSFGVVLMELLTASAPAWCTRGPDGSKEYHFLVNILKGDLRNVLQMTDARAGFPHQVAYALAELSVRCTQMAEEHRPDFSEVVTIIRPLRDAPDAQMAAPPLPVVSGGGASCGGMAVAAHGGIAASVAPHAAMPQHVAQPGYSVAPGGLVMPPVQRHFQSPRLSHQPLQPVLWTLECIFSEPLGGTSGVPPERRMLVHRQEPGLSVPCPLKVGRSFQDELFTAMLPVEDLRNMVSREHFEIWASDASSSVEPAGAGDDNRAPYHFYITNVGVNLTSINGVLLHQQDRHARLHEGDIIGLGRITSSSAGNHYSPYIQFRFALLGSVLRDAAAPNVHAKEMVLSSLHARASPEASVIAGSAILAPRVLPPAPPTSATDRAVEGQPQQEGMTCTSLCGDVSPRFVLEVGGSGVRSDAAVESTRIVHGPLLGTEMETNAPFPPLILGRGHFTPFWQGLLREEAFQAFSRDHVVFEDSGAALQTVVIPGATPASGVTARNLSAMRPVRVCCSTAEEAIIAAPPLEAEERRMLRHGDILVLNTSRACTLWLVFYDLNAPEWGAEAQSGVELPKAGESAPGCAAGGA